MKQVPHILLLKLLTIFMLLVVGISCSSNKISTQESNYQYNNKIKDLDPSFLVYHESEEVSYLYFELETKDLLYTRENSSKPFEAKVIIEYSLFEDYKGKVIIDSAAKVLYDYKTANGNKRILGRIPIKMPLGKKGVLKVVARDAYKKINSQKIIDVNKKNTMSSQFFLIKEKKSGDVCFDSYFTSNNTLTVHSHFNPTHTFIVDYFNTDFPPSRPPFSKNSLVEVPSKKDSTVLLSLVNKTGEIQLNRLGSYYIRSVDSISYSITLQRLDSNFKYMYSYMGLIGPLKYICTSLEYKALENALDKRKAVEEFWIKIAGSKERAKVVIEEYYRRVELANKFFTSYKEGWKTDRGMLSIVMGLPNTIYKNSNGETWIYGTPHNMMMSLTFNFSKENEEKSGNDYQLARYRTYRDYWYRGCESWRQGRIYNFN
mgnify:CR=1 FL=1